MKTYTIPEPLLTAAFNLIERMPASREVRAVLNGIEAHVQQQEQAAAERDTKNANPVLQGGGGPGSDDPPVKK